MGSGTTVPDPMSLKSTERQSSLSEGVGEDHGLAAEGRVDGLEREVIDQAGEVKIDLVVVDCVRLGLERVVVALSLIHI